MTGRRVSVLAASVVGLAAIASAARAQDAGESDADVEDGPELVFDEASAEVIIIEDDAAPRRAAAETRVTGGRAAQTPGVQGDAVKAVHTLPGVARAAAGSDGVAVWGAAPADTRLYVDDIPVPRLFHLGGSRSIVPTDAVSALSLVPGGAGARYGRGIGGVVEVVTDVPRREVGARAHLDPIDVGGGAHAWLGARTWIAASGRRGLLRDTFDVVAPDRAGELVAAPDYWDVQARARHRLGDGDELHVLALGAGDRLSRGIPSLSETDAFRQDADARFLRLGVRLVRLRGSGTSRTLGAWVGTDRDRTRFDFGDVGAEDDRRRVAGGLLLSETRSVGARVTVRFGIDAELSRTRVSRDGAISLPAREGDIGAFGQPPGDRVNRDNWAAVTAGVGGHVTARIDVGDTVTVEPGLRLEPGFVSGNRVVPVRPTEPAVGYTERYLAADPRLRATWRATSKLELFAAGGRYHQPPAAADLSPVFGTPILADASSWQGLAGAIATPMRQLAFEVVGFGVRQERLAVRSPLATPPLAGLLVSTGQGRTVGAQLSARFARGRFATGLAYSLMRAQRRDDADGSYRRFDHDQTHVVHVTAQWTHASGVELGGRLEVASGFPRTPVVGAAFNARSQRFDPMFGAHNADRLPTYAALSARAAWTGRHYKVWLDVQNVTNRDNAEEVFYTADFANKDFVRGLPIVPVIGAEVRL